jgi:prepilin-type N-terminal cleavage/methylation domain-containing protein
MQIHSTQSGFTLIEMLVSLALYTIVVTTSVGSLLVLIETNGRLVGEQAVMSSLTFAMDSMTREIRTGKSYYCESATNLKAAPPATTATRICTGGDAGISFVEAGSSITGTANTRIAYYYEVVSNVGTLYRRIGNSTPTAMTGNDIDITAARFFVTGADPLDGANDVNQPLVTIYLEAEDRSGDIERSITLHTSIVQRELDL